MKNKTSILFWIFLLVQVVAFGQREVSGTILSKEDNEPVVGAVIRVKSTTLATISDENGKFTISLPKDRDSLSITASMKEPQDVKVGADNTLTIYMSDEVNELESVVVTALGIKRDEKSIGYAISKVDGDVIRNSNQTNVINALGGVVAGANVTQSSGTAGGSSRITLRGFTSLTGNNQALIVIDGVKVNNEELNTEETTEGVAYSNRGVDINPNDIESVSVLKGGAASALYGIDGANGVVVITTKRGKVAPGESRFSVSVGSSIGISQVNRLPQLQNKYSQGTAWYSADGVTPEYFAPETGWLTSWGPAYTDLSWDGATDYAYDKNGNIVLNSDPSAKTAVTPYNNMKDFFRTGTTVKNNFSISGGNDILTFRFSGSNMRESGIVPNNVFQKSNISFGTGMNLMNNKLNIVTTTNYINSGGTRIQQGSNLSGVMLGLLRTPITFDNANGNASKPWDSADSYELADGSQRNFRGGGGYDNPFWTVNKNPFNDEVNRLIQNVQATYTFSKWLIVGTNLGLDTYSDRRQQRFAIGSRAFPTGKIIEDNFNVTQTDAYLTATGRGFINKAKTFDFSYTAGLNSFTYSNNNLRATGSNLAFDDFENVGNTTQMNIKRTLTKHKSLSAFASIDLGYKSMLFLTVTARQDYDSRFVTPGKEFKASDIGFFYPSVSGSWVFTELFAKKKILSFGKLRASFAQIAKGPKDAYVTSTTYQQTSGLQAINDGWTEGIAFPYAGQNTYLLNKTAGNPNIVPEKTNDFEVGTSLMFFQKRLVLDAAYYHRQTNNAIVEAAVSGTSGFNYMYMNTGQLHTNGVDITLGGTPVDRKNFSWNVSASFTRAITMVDKLSDGLDQLFVAGFTGSAIYHIPGYQYGQIFGGDYAHDASGNLVIDNDPTSPTYGYPLADPVLKVIGNPNPKFLLGITNSLQYKNFSLNFLIDMKVGGQMWNGTQGALTFFGMSENTEDRDAPGTTSTVFEGVGGHYDVDGNLILDGAANAQQVGLNEDWYTGNGGGFGNVATPFVQNASTYRLRNLTISYTIPADQFKKGKVKEIRFYLTGMNLLLFTPYTGVDPETSLVGSDSNGQGLDYFNMPNTRSYTLGLNLKF